MGPSLKLQRPFIWQDEMVEVRELFRRVDRVRKSGFTGFSTWGSPPPSANMLSRNRLRRRRALCSVELSHLNYKEAPFESLNHMQNIRGMCTRIQRQNYVVERKKKDVDLENRPPLLRRPITSINVERRGRKRPPFEVGRPYSAPVISMQNPRIGATNNIISSTPLQYATPKFTSLYDITRKSSSSTRTSTRKSFNVLLPAFDECPSTTSSKHRFSTNNPHQRCTSIMSEQRVSRDIKPSMVELKPRNEQIEVTTKSSCELFNVGKDPQPCIKYAKQHQALQNYHSGSDVTTLESLDVASINCNNMNCSFSRDTTPDAIMIEKLAPFSYCRWSTSDEVTTSSDIDISISTHDSKYHTKDVSFSNFQDPRQVSKYTDFKDHESEMPSFILPISDYNQALSGMNLSERRLSPSKKTSTPLLSKSKVINSKYAHIWNVSLHKRPTTPLLNGGNLIDMNKQRPSTIRSGHDIASNDLDLHDRNELRISSKLKDDFITNQSWQMCDVENNITLDPKKTTIGFDKNLLRSINLTSTPSIFGANAILASGTNCTNTTAESRWLTTTPKKVELVDSTSLHQGMMSMDNTNCSKCSSEEDEILLAQEKKLFSSQVVAVAATADDSNVLIKHSSDPYSDFRLSMITMIEEEGLQNQHDEMEELFQYYLDLNPKVHHQVLHKVIDDIRSNYNFLQNFTT